MRWATVLLVVAVLGVQGQLWLGRENMPQVMSLARQLDEQKAANTAAAERNARALAEVSDLREGLEMVEEKARRELGMLRPDEILVQVQQVQAAPASEK
jgi:cell division protein FtsB